MTFLKTFTLCNLRVKKKNNNSADWTLFVMSDRVFFFFFLLKIISLHFETCLFLASYLLLFNVGHVVKINHSYDNWCSRCETRLLFQNNLFSEFSFFFFLFFLIKIRIDQRNSIQIKFRLLWISKHVTVYFIKNLCCSHVERSRLWNGIIGCNFLTHNRNFSIVLMIFLRMKLRHNSILNKFAYKHDRNFSDKY